MKQPANGVEVIQDSEGQNKHLNEGQGTWCVRFNMPGETTKWLASTRSSSYESRPDDGYLWVRRTFRRQMFMDEAEATAAAVEYALTEGIV